MVKNYQFFSATGLTHNELAVEIVKHAKIAEKEHEKFCIVFAAMGVNTMLHNTLNHNLNKRMLWTVYQCL